VSKRKLKQRKTYSAVREERDELPFRVKLDLDQILARLLTEQDWLANNPYFVRFEKCKRLDVNIALLVQREGHQELHVHPEHLKYVALSGRARPNQPGEDLFRLFFNFFFNFIFVFFFSLFCVSYSRLLLARIHNFEGSVDGVCSFVLLSHASCLGCFDEWCLCTVEVLCLQFFLLRVVSHFLNKNYK